MQFLVRVLDALLNFLFPKSERVLELEKLTPAELLSALPQAEYIKDDNVIAIFSYAHPVVKELIWELKYRGNLAVADKLGAILADIIREELMERAIFEKFERPILMPVPISDKRRFERGWNQAELLCQAVKKGDKHGEIKYLPRQLAKLVHTESQTKTSSKTERQNNLRKTMRVLNPTLVKGRCVVVVDDVMTTGSTFAEARRALRDAGAKKVLCIAVAH